MPPKKASKTRKAFEVKLARKSANTDQTTGKRNGATKAATRHPAPAPVNDIPLSITENSCLEFDSLMSVELVQTAMAAIFYEIFWFRCKQAFPGHPWQFRSYDPTNPNNSYQAYVEGDDFVPAAYGEHRWKVPKRGEDPRVDKLMNVLESCSKEPIEKHWLKKLQLCFHSVDGNGPSEANLIESYSLTFEHYNDRIAPRFTTHGDLVPTDKLPLTLFEGRQTLKAMVDNLLQYLYYFNARGRVFKTQPLPVTDHSAKFSMIFLAEYNDSAPNDYHPPYFKPGTTATSAVLNLCPKDDRFVMDTGYHVVSAGCLLPGPVAVQPNSPAAMQSSQNDVHHRAPVASSAVSKAVGDYLSQHKASMQVQRTLNEEVQQRAVHHLQHAGLSRGDHVATQDTQRFHLYLPSPVHPVKSQSQTRPLAPPYTQDILDELHGRLLEFTNTSRSDDLDEPQAVGSKDVIVKCECGCKKEDKHMIHCVRCQHFQHPECYGYLGQEQPENQFCYSCLTALHPEEKPQLDLAIDMCMNRRALHFLRAQQDVVSCEELAKHLGCTSKSVASTVKHLAEAGMVRLVKKHRGFTTEYVGNDEALVREYFQPQKHINSLFALSATSGALESETGNVRNNINRYDASIYFPDGAANAQPSTAGPSQRYSIDDDATQSESSLQQGQTPPSNADETYSLQSIAQRGLNLSPGNMTTPTKRRTDADSPEAVKRMRLSQTSPFLL